MKRKVNRFVAHQKVGVTIQLGMALLYIFIMPLSSLGSRDVGIGFSFLF